jgi:hypothetical protein
LPPDPDDAAEEEEEETADDAEEAVSLTWRKRQLGSAQAPRR